MASVKLQGGLEIDVATPGDVEQSFERHRRLSQRQRPILARNRALLAADGAGNIGGGLAGNGAGSLVIRAVPGQRYDFLRVVLHAPGTTPTAPLAQGWLWLVKDTSNGEPEMFWPASGTQVAPAMYTDGDSCMRLWGGEQLYAFGAGLPANQALVLRFQYRIIPDVAALRADPEAGRS